ncbi:hypothetical protein [Yoonia sp. SS1-5]|uniref:Uncharacterized protein n=1 Tax=Yoonia rhodophyticola TaxID=3137370 RepID=A0AAN0NH77_9RHOB
MRDPMQTLRLKILASYWAIMAILSFGLVLIFHALARELGLPTTHEWVFGISVFSLSLMISVSVWATNINAGSKPLAATEGS